MSSALSAGLKDHFEIILGHLGSSLAVFALVVLVVPSVVCAGPGGLGIDRGGNDSNEGVENGGTTSVQRRQFVMGTWLDVTVQGRDRAHALAAAEAALEAVEATDRRLSTWRDDSELATVNRGGSSRFVEISRDLARDLRDALRWSRQTDGTFNPAMGSLIAAWDLRGSGRVPGENELSEALAASRVTDVFLQDRRVRLAGPGLSFEEGGFGKGAALRDALTAARASGATCVVVDFGGQVGIEGVCDSRSIGVANPRDRYSEMAILDLESGSAATSGLSERTIVVDGVRYGHILDPRDGRPARDWGSVTVVAADPFAADCLSTALYVMGPDAGARWAARQPGIEALFVEESTETVRFKATEGLRFRLALPTGHEVEWIPDVEVRQHGSPGPLNRGD